MSHPLGNTSNEIWPPIENVRPKRSPNFSFKTWTNLSRHPLCLSHCSKAFLSGRPRNDLEASLLSVWKSVLGLNQLSIHTSFFEVGGHSLLAGKVVSRIRSKFQVRCPVSLLLKNPTVMSFSQSLCLLVGTSPSDLMSNSRKLGHSFGNNFEKQEQRHI